MRQDRHVTYPLDDDIWQNNTVLARATYTEKPILKLNFKLPIWENEENFKSNKVTC